MVVIMGMMVFVVVVLGVSVRVGRERGSRLKFDSDLFSGDGVSARVN